MKRNNKNIEKEVEFFNSLKLSENTIRGYRIALNSKFFVGYLMEYYGYDSIFDINDVSVLWEIYSELNLHPKNVTNHRCYSSVVMKYLKYLNNGDRYGKRIDFGKKRNG